MEYINKNGKEINKFMRDEYVREEKIKEKNDAEKRRELIRSIITTQKLLEQAHQNFEYAEEDLIDYYSYNIKANQAKLDYLIKKAKAKGIIMNFALKSEINAEPEVS